MSHKSRKLMYIYHQSRGSEEAEALMNTGDKRR